MSRSTLLTNPYRASKAVHLSSSDSQPLNRAVPSQSSSYAHLSQPSKSSRRRGAVLAQQGWQKLEQAGVLYDDFGRRYTYAELSERSLLANRTVSRILSCETKVDKRTLKIFFQAFNLHLDEEDYILPESHARGLVAALIGLGIPKEKALKYEIDIKVGKFLVIMVATDEDLQQAQQILQNSVYDSLRGMCVDHK